MLSASFAETIFWIAAVLCLAAQTAILRAAFRSTDGETEATVPHSSQRVERLWAVIPAIALGILLAATWRAIR